MRHCTAQILTRAAKFRPISHVTLYVLYPHKQSTLTTLRKVLPVLQWQIDMCLLNELTQPSLTIKAPVLHRPTVIAIQAQY